MNESIDRRLLPGLTRVRTTTYAIGEPPSNLGPLRRCEMPRVVFQPGDKPYDWAVDADWWRT